MDCEATDVRILDVSRRLRSVSFCYQTNSEIAALSVAEISHAAAFDEIGRPIPGGLYDVRLGPTSWNGGSCATCGLSYGTCPGHFGHIRLPFPLVHPQLSTHLQKLLKAACWHCGRLRLVGRRKLLLLARLRFEHVGDVDAARFVKAYLRGALDKVAGMGRPAAGKTLEEHTEAREVGEATLGALLRGAPRGLKEKLNSVAEKDRSEKVVDAIIAGAAQLAWEDAEKAGTLVETPKGEWDECVSAVFINVGTKCPCCMEKVTPITKGPTGTFFFGRKATPQAVLSTMQLAEQVKRVWEAERDICELVYGLKGRTVRRGSPLLDHEMFFVRNVLVPPSRFRPAAAMQDTGLSAEHPQNVFYQRMLMSLDSMVELKAETELAKGGVGDGDGGEAAHVGGEAAGNGGASGKRKKKPRKAGSESLEYMKLVAEMQRTINDLYDSPGGDLRVNGGAMGIRQQLETKQGLFRMHMMGKRVNYSCRSVIGPDVFLDTNEVGIPESFAKQLTVAEPVTPLNVARMQQAVLNGPDVYPGANAVEDWSRGGQLQTVVLRSSSNKKQLETQAKLLVRSTRNVDDVGLGKVNGHEGRRGGQEDEEDGHSFTAAGEAESGAVLPKRVLRHLKTGDVVLFNRQPTLHRVSMMAHKVRVLPGDKTIRFHYSNCSSYNADFDGDEMNVHVPQDDIARAEALELMLSDQHYITPTSGEPIRSLIQDHILAAALISKRGTFFGREEFSALLYSATERIMSGSAVDGERRFTLPVPTVLKPRQMWTGKQLISAVLKAISGEQAGLSLTCRSRVSADLVGSEEAQVLFRKGELLRGVMDKNSIGASKFGIVHAVQETYGAHAAGNFLSAIGRLCTLFIRRHGHTTGVDDLMLVVSAEGDRLQSLTSSVGTIGAEVARDVHESFSQEDRADDDTSGDSDDVVMTESAKVAVGPAASFEETCSLVADLVQREGAVAEARLDAAMAGKLNALSSVVNKSVPSGLVKRFPSNGFSLMTDTGAKGSAVNSKQISCLLGSTIMDGKRVPRMGGSGSTLPCFAPYDPTPNAGGFIASRFLTGMAPYEMFFHAMAGREGLLDTSLKTANSGYLQRCLVKHLEGVRLHYDYTARDANGMVVQMLYGDDGIDPCKASWLMSRLPWLLENKDALAGVEHGQSKGEPGKVLKPSKTIRSLQKAFRKTDRESDTTLLEAASPGSLAKFGVVSETFQAQVNEALSALPDKKSRSRAEAFFWRRYQRAAAEPGEGVGIIAAHSVGEPSTQMTLNTFHHAGSESKHVTLGVPRLRELLMIAAKYPKTPTMTLPLLEGLGEGSARELSRRFANVSLLDLVERVVVQEGGVSFQPGLADSAVHNFVISLEFPEESLYLKELGFGFSRILEVVESTFVKTLGAQFSKELKKISIDIKKSSGIDQSKDDVDDGPDVPDPPPVPDSGAGAGKGGRKDQEALVEVEASDDDNSAVGEDSEDDAPDSDMDEQEIENDVDGVASDENSAGVTGSVSLPDESEQEKKIRLWREAKKAELESKAEKSKKSRESGKSRKKGGAKPLKTSAAVKDEDQGEDDSPVGFSGVLGLTDDVTADDSGRKIIMPWVFPNEVTGRMRVAELVRETASEVKLANVHRITRCFTEEVEGGIGKQKGLAVATEGSNLTAALELCDGFVDLDSISTNDMFGILNTYGVEALRAALIAEFKKIFDAYGIAVDNRHLSIIADYQCALGGYRSFSRLTMNTAASTMQQFSFETTMKFMTEAALSGRPDPVMTAPSAAVACGEIYSGGTGSFQVLSQVT